MPATTPRRTRRSTERPHNEWFQPLADTSRCQCGLSRQERKLKYPGDFGLYAWGEYIHGKWNKVTNFCHSCFPERVLQRLQEHSNQCGCTIVANSRSQYSIPDWLQFEVTPQSRTLT